MAKTKTQTKDQKPAAEGNRYIRAARVLARDDKIEVATLADRAFMSESTAARCLEAWNACVGALREAGKLPDPTKPAAKKAPHKAKPAAKPPTAAGPTQSVEQNGQVGPVVDTGVVAVS